MALDNFRAAPLPNPPLKWDPQYMRQVLRVLELYFGQLDSRTPNNAQQYSAARFIGGIFLSRIRSVTGTAVVAAGDSILLADATAGAVTVPLPAAADNEGRTITVKKIDASVNTVTLDGDGSETIDNAATKVISTQYASVSVVSDGAEWWIV